MWVQQRDQTFVLNDSVRGEGCRLTAKFRARIPPGMPFKTKVWSRFSPLILYDRVTTL